MLIDSVSEFQRGTAGHATKKSAHVGGIFEMQPFGDSCNGKLRIGKVAFYLDKQLLIEDRKSVV